MPEEKCRYTAIAYSDEDPCVRAGESDYDDLDEAIGCCLAHGWDEVVDNRTGRIAWRRG